MNPRSIIAESPTAEEWLAQCLRVDAEARKVIARWREGYIDSFYENIVGGVSRGAALTALGELGGLGLGVICSTFSREFPVMPAPVRVGDGGSTGRVDFACEFFLSVAGKTWPVVVQATSEQNCFDHMLEMVDQKLKEYAP